MATTTNYGWTTPDDTALVKDGASAIRSLGTSVDTTTKALNPSTTLGDIEYRSSTSNTNTRLGIGSTGQILTVANGVPSWATAAASVPTNGQNQVLTSQSTTSTSFTDLTTSQAVTVTTGTRALVILSAVITTPSPADLARCRMGFAISGATTVAASNDYNLCFQGNNANAYFDYGGVSNSFIVTGLTAGSNTFTAKFLSSTGSAATFEDRRIAVIDMGS